MQALIPSQQQGTYYTQPLYAAPPHVIHHTTVVQPNGMPAAMYAPPIHPPRHNGVTMGMVAGTTMAMSAGKHRFLIGCLSLDGRDVQKKGNTSVCCAVHKGLKIYFIFLFLRGAIRISLLLQCNRSKSGPLFFVVKVCIITYIVSYSCTWCSFCGHFASQEPC